MRYVYTVQGLSFSFPIFLRSGGAPLVPLSSCFETCLIYPVASSCRLTAIRTLPSPLALSFPSSEKLPF